MACEQSSSNPLEFAVCIACSCAQIRILLHSITTSSYFWFFQNPRCLTGLQQKSIFGFQNRFKETRASDCRCGLLLLLQQQVLLLLRDRDGSKCLGRGKGSQEYRKGRKKFHFGMQRRQVETETKGYRNGIFWNILRSRLVKNRGSSRID